MNTSSSEGRATLTERIGWPSSANRRGTNCSPEDTPKMTVPSAFVASMPNRSRRAAIASSSSSVSICTRSLPTFAFSASGVSSTITHLIHDRDAVAVLGLVHVVGGEEDGDLLARLQLADVAPDRAARLRVEAHGGLVQEQHPRRVQQAAGDLEPPLHP